MSLRQDAQEIYTEAIRRALPDVAVQQALNALGEVRGRVLLVSVGKAGWQMARAACGVLGPGITAGIVITKYHHSRGPLPPLEIWEAGHPIVDDASFRAAGRALELVRGLTAEDTVLFLLSGGGSALFERSELPLEELQEISRQLLSYGADIQEINCIRKRLSAVKGGRFGAACAPARVVSVILSDVVGDRLDMIASGPACVDTSTKKEALEIVERYHLRLSAQAKDLLERPLPSALPHVENHLCGSVSQLCASAMDSCRRLGYRPVLVSDHVDCEVRDAGSELAALLRRHGESREPLAFILGGETVVKLTGRGKGGRNQELALSAAAGIAGMAGAAVFSVGSDGTDGPTDAAGGFVDGSTAAALAGKGLSIPEVLAQNDAYHALACVDGLIFTGPTGTNVNDLSVALLRPESTPEGNHRT